MNPLPVIDPKDPSLPPVKPDEKLYLYLVLGTAAAYVLLAIAGILTWNVMLLPFFNVGGPLFLIVIVHLLLSWTVVDQDDWAALFFYGRALKAVEPGPQFVPRGLIQVVRVPRGLQQFQAPGEPEQIFHGDDKDALPPGMVRPIRITTREPNEDEKGRLDIQMTFSWTFYVQFQILDLFMFISRVGSFEHAMKLIRDTGEAVLNEFASDMTVNGMIRNLKTINETLDNRIRELVNGWGMQIYEAKALAPNLSHALATALRDVGVTNINAENTRTAAAAQRDRLIQEGEGAATARSAMLTAEADGRKAFLTAEADGLKAKMENLKVDGATIIAAEAASDALKDANAVIVGAEGGMRDLLGMVVAGKKVLDSERKSA